MSSGGGRHQPATVLAAQGSGLRRAVMAGHRGDVDEALRLLGDHDAAVRSAALGALERLGALDPDMLATALADSDPAVRRRACASAARVLAAGGAAPIPDGSPDERRAALVATLVTVVTSDPEASVVEAAAFSLGEAGPGSGGAVVAALERVATGHRDPLCRESAVAALGAVGEPGSLGVVLAALEDKPAIRRRAAVALAAFDGPDADRGLRRCLEDRDWQVRQAAEDLLERR